MSINRLECGMGSTFVDRITKAVQNPEPGVLDGDRRARVVFGEYAATRRTLTARSDACAWSRRTCSSATRARAAVPSLGDVQRVYGASLRPLSMEIDGGGCGSRRRGSSRWHNLWGEMLRGSRFGFFKRALEAAAVVVAEATVTFEPAGFALWGVDASRVRFCVLRIPADSFDFFDSPGTRALGVPMAALMKFVRAGDADARFEFSCGMNELRVRFWSGHLCKSFGIKCALKPAPPFEMDAAADASAHTRPYLLYEAMGPEPQGYVRLRVDSRGVELKLDDSKTVFLKCEPLTVDTRGECAQTFGLAFLHEVLRCKIFRTSRTESVQLLMRRDAPLVVKYALDRCSLVFAQSPCQD